MHGYKSCHKCLSYSTLDAEGIEQTIDTYLNDEQVLLRKLVLKIRIKGMASMGVKGVASMWPAVKWSKGRCYT